MGTQGRPVYLVGAGTALPPFRYTNLELAPYFNVDEETALRYADVTGIEARHWVIDLADGRRQKVLSDQLAAQAAQRALDAAGMEPTDLDCVITSASLYDFILPSIGPRVLKNLGVQEAMSFDLVGGCAQFILGVIMGANYIRSGMCDTVVVTASEVISSFSRQFRYPVDAFIFGDGAGAWVLSSEPGRSGFPVFEVGDTACATVSEFEGRPTEVIVMPIAGFKEEFDLFIHDERVDPRMADIHPDTRHQYRFRHDVDLARDVARFGILEGFKRVSHGGQDTPGVVVPHQGTGPVLRSVEPLLPEGWSIIDNLRERGNVSTVCIPMAFSDQLERVREARTVVAAAVGVGFTYAAARLVPVS